MAAEGVEEYLLTAIAAMKAALNQKNIRTWYACQKLSAIHLTKRPLMSVSSRTWTTYATKNAQKRKLTSNITIR